MNNFDTISPDELVESYTLDGVYPEVISFDSLTPILIEKMQNPNFGDNIATYFNTLNPIKK